MELKQEIEDLFDKEICVKCDAKCHPGSGRYVNRYPYYGDEYEGWVCGFCAEKPGRYVINVLEDDLKELEKHWPGEDHGTIATVGD